MCNLEFRVKDSSGKEVVQVSGANVNLGGFVLDKLYFSDASGKKARRAPDPPHAPGVGALALNAPHDRVDGARRPLADIPTAFRTDVLGRTPRGGRDDKLRRVRRGRRVRGKDRARAALAHAAGAIQPRTAHPDRDRMAALCWAISLTRMIDRPAV